MRFNSQFDVYFNSSWGTADNILQISNHFLVLYSYSNINMYSRLIHQTKIKNKEINFFWGGGICACPHLGHCTLSSCDVIFFTSDGIQAALSQFTFQQEHSIHHHTQSNSVVHPVFYPMATGGSLCGLQHPED